MKQDDPVLIVGGGAAGLMAAEELCRLGRKVDVFDAMPSPGRKILMAGKSGLNISHAEPFHEFVQRYGVARDWIDPMVKAFGADHVQTWAADLGVETFVGSSGRIFPKEMKAAPLLRSWLRRLKSQGMRLYVRHRWTGFDDDGALLFETPDGLVKKQARVVLLATGGASWPALGSDGSWLPWLEQMKIECRPFRPANCGFDCDWSDIFSDRFAGEPVKSVMLSAGGQMVSGDFVITRTGVEGSAIYALSAVLRDMLERDGRASLLIDLAPGRCLERLEADLSKARGKKSFSAWLRNKTGLSPVKAALMREMQPDLFSMRDPKAIAALIKALPVPVQRTRPMEEAISVAGGVGLDGLDENLMLREHPGLFLAGEMLDWEAPTGGYLLTACFAQGKRAGQGIHKYLEELGDRT